MLHRTRTADALLGQGAQCTRLSPNGASCRAPTPPVYGSLPQPLVTLMHSELRVCPMRAHANTQREAEHCSLRKRTPCEPSAPPVLLACLRPRTARPASLLPAYVCTAVQGSARLALQAAPCSRHTQPTVLRTAPARQGDRTQAAACQCAPLRHAQWCYIAMRTCSGSVVCVPPARTRWQAVADSNTHVCHVMPLNCERSLRAHTRAGRPWHAS